MKSETLPTSTAGRMTNHFPGSCTASLFNRSSLAGVKNISKILAARAKTWALLLVLLFSVNLVQAADHTAVASGDWNTPATWSPASLPSNTDNVIIPAGVDVTINAANAVCLNLNIAAAASL